MPTTDPMHDADLDSGKGPIEKALALEKIGSRSGEIAPQEAARSVVSSAVIGFAATVSIALLQACSDNVQILVARYPAMASWVPIITAAVGLGISILRKVAANTQSKGFL